MKLPEGIGFTAEDFEPAAGLPQVDIIHVDIAAERANAKLPALFEAWVKREGVRVYNHWDGNVFSRTNWTETKWVEDTHTGYVVMCEEIKK